MLGRQKRRLPRPPIPHVQHAKRSLYQRAPLPLVPPGPHAPARLRDALGHDAVQQHVAQGRVEPVLLVVQRQQGVGNARGLSLWVEG